VYRTCNVWSSGTWLVSRKHHNSDADHTTHAYNTVYNDVILVMVVIIRTPRDGAKKNRDFIISRWYNNNMMRPNSTRAHVIVHQNAGRVVFRGTVTGRVLFGRIWRRWKVPGIPREIGTKSVSLIMPLRRRPGSLIGRLRLRTESRQNRTYIRTRNHAPPRAAAAAAAVAHTHTPCTRILVTPFSRPSVRYITFWTPNKNAYKKKKKKTHIIVMIYR